MFMKLNKDSRSWTNIDNQDYQVDSSGFNHMLNTAQEEYPRVSRAIAPQQQSNASQRPEFEEYTYQANRPADIRGA